MHFSTLLLPSLLAVASALEPRKNHNGTHVSSTKQTCAEIRQLTHLTSLASNQTRLDALVASNKLSSSDADALKSKAATASTKLATLTSNATLTSECAVIDTNEKTMQECKQMKRLQKMADLASNTTALDAYVAKKGANATDVKMKLQGAEVKLKKMKANETLVGLCAMEKVRHKNGTETADGGAGGKESGSAGSTAAQVSKSGAAGAVVRNVGTVILPVVLGVLFMTL